MGPPRWERVWNLAETRLLVRAELEKAQQRVAVWHDGGTTWQQPASQCSQAAQEGPTAFPINGRQACAE